MDKYTQDRLVEAVDQMIDCVDNLNLKATESGINDPELDDVNRDVSFIAKLTPQNSSYTQAARRLLNDILVYLDLDDPDDDANQGIVEMFRERAELEILLEYPFNNLSEKQHGMIDKLINDRLVIVKKEIRDNAARNTVAMLTQLYD